MQYGIGHKRSCDSRRPQHERCSSAIHLSTPKECWLSHVCTGGRQNKAQKMWLVSGLQDHRYLSVKIESKDARG